MERKPNEGDSPSAALNSQLILGRLERRNVAEITHNSGKRLLSDRTFTDPVTFVYFDEYRPCGNLVRTFCTFFRFLLICKLFIGRFFNSNAPIDSSVIWKKKMRVLFFRLSMLFCLLVVTEFLLISIFSIAKFFNNNTRIENHCDNVNFDERNVQVVTLPFTNVLFSDRDKSSD